MTTFLGVPILVHGEAWGNLYLTDKHDGEFTADDEEAVVMLAEWAAIAIENARRLDDVRSRRDELERTIGAMSATVEISRALAGETDLDRILQLIAKRGRALVGARVLVIELAHGRPGADRRGRGRDRRRRSSARSFAAHGSVAERGAPVAARRSASATSDNRARFEKVGLGSRFGGHGPARGCSSRWRSGPRRPASSSRSTR